MSLLKGKLSNQDAVNQLNTRDIKWLLKCIFESHNVWGSDIEQAVKTINKLKNQLESTNVINKD